jgi:hypothetical protein
MPNSKNLIFFGPGIKNFLEIFHLAPIKQILKYLPGNIQDPIKNIYLESVGWGGEVLKMGQK